MAVPPVRLWARKTTAVPSFQESQPLDAPQMPIFGPARGLPPVHFEDRSELRTIVGLRPYRPSGFLVQTEKVNENLVVHNYGHGGAGITLSWGTAQLALQMGCYHHTGPVAVLGSGAVGLATARLLQEAGFNVTIYTKDLPLDTTSNKAGGEWIPFLVTDPEKSDARFNQQLLAAAEFSHKRFQAMLGTAFGIRWIASYHLARHGFNEAGLFGTQSAFRGMMPGLRDLNPDEHPFPLGSSVRRFETLLIEPPTYLPAMLDAFRQSSGTIVVREIPDRQAVAQLPERLIFNCTGLGAKAIFDDAELIPVRGQSTILKPQREVDYAVGYDELYMLPRMDGILLGGTYELGMDSLTPDIAKQTAILARHKAFFDSYRTIRR
jgi:glycine/D-amino acid oxidase-like deaminating enzyme